VIDNESIEKGEATCNQEKDKKLKNGCLAKTTINLRNEVTSNKIGKYIQYMKDHAFIGNFMVIWPSNMTLTWWVKTRWKPKGQVDLKLGSKGFFTMIFTSIQD
jgi:hypothetical protein